MKKIILSALVAVASLSASAQVWLGGDISFGTTKPYDGAENCTKFTIAPQVGYMFSEKFGLGLNLKFTAMNDNGAAYNLLTASASDVLANPGNYAKNSFGAGLFARYIFAKAGIASFFFDGGVDFETYKDMGSKIAIAIQPGVKFAASEKIDVVAKIGYLGWQKYLGDKSSKGSYFGIGLEESALSLGMSYSF